MDPVPFLSITLLVSLIIILGRVCYAWGYGNGFSHGRRAEQDYIKIRRHAAATRQSAFWYGQN